MKYNSYVLTHKLQPHELFFATLGNAIRWRIIHLLQRRSYRSTDIGRKLQAEQSLISHHLRRLETCGFVHVTKRGKTRIYRLNAKTIKPLVALMDTHIDSYCKHVCARRTYDYR